jgi:CheY-like chemotaxis protein
MPAASSPLRVLVVDDDPGTVNSVAHLLARCGHEVRTALDGPEALAAAGEFHPAVAVLDLGLPGMDGYELARRLRALPGLEGVRLVALTGLAGAAQCWLSGREGFAFHLVKPAEPAAIEAALGALAGECVGRLPT